jgi:hypothetical protein
MVFHVKRCDASLRSLRMSRASENADANSPRNSASNRAGSACSCLLDYQQPRIDNSEPIGRDVRTGWGHGVSVVRQHSWGAKLTPGDVGAVEPGREKALVHVSRATAALRQSSCVWISVFHVKRSGPRADRAKGGRYVFVWAISISRTYPALADQKDGATSHGDPCLIPMQSDVLWKSCHETLPDRRAQGR